MSHKNLKTIPYCYLIGWTSLEKFYFGVKFGKNANPNTFWKNYFTSSQVVNKYRLKYGEPDIIQIRKTFPISKYKDLELAQEAAVKYEQTVLKRANLIENKKFLNCSANVESRTKERATNHRKMREEMFNGSYFSKKGLENIKKHNSKYTKKNNPMNKKEVKQKHSDSIAQKYGYKNHKEYLDYIKRSFEKYQTIKETSDQTGHSQYTIRHLLKRNFGSEYIEQIRKEGLKRARNKAAESNRNRIKTDISGSKNPNAYVWEAVSPTGKIHLLFGNRIQFCKEQGIGTSLEPNSPHKRGYWKFTKLCRVKDYTA